MWWCWWCAVVCGVDASPLTGPLVMPWTLVDALVDALVMPWCPGCPQGESWHCPHAMVLISYGPQGRSWHCPRVLCQCFKLVRPTRPQSCRSWHSAVLKVQCPQPSKVARKLTSTLDEARGPRLNADRHADPTAREAVLLAPRPGCVVLIASPDAQSACTGMCVCMLTSHDFTHART